MVIGQYRMDHPRSVASVGARSEGGAQGWAARSGRDAEVGMTKRAVETAASRAADFLQKAGDLLGGSDWEIHGSAQSGAVRRASLELTRALAVMRRPG